MRVYDIIAENQDLDEAPAGALAQMGRKIGAKALGAIGFKGKAAELTGKAEVGDEANQLKIALRQYAGKAGINVKQMQGPQLAAFLKSKGYPNMHLKGVQGIMTPKQIDQAIMQAAQDAAKADGDPSKGAAPSAASAAAPQTDANKDGKDDKTGEPMKAPQQGGTNVAGKPATPQVDKNKDGKDDATGEPMKPAAGAAPKAANIPPELKKKIDGLNAQQKQELVALL